jgi:hypothetical protein
VRHRAVAAQIAVPGVMLRVDAALGHCPVQYEKFEFPVEWGIDLQNDDGRTVAAMDVLAPGIGEIIGGRARGAARRSTARALRSPRRNPYAQIPRRRSPRAWRPALLDALVGVGQPIQD